MTETHVFRNLEDFNLLREVSQFLPWISRTFPKLSGYQETQRDGEFVRSYIYSFLRKHMDAHEPGKPRTFLDMYADKINATTDPSSSFYKSVGGIVF